MTIIKMFSKLRINITSLCEYLNLKPNAISNKMVLGYDITEEQLPKMKEYLDMKVREMIKIIKKIDKLLDHNK